jgi:hypothetical protein
MIPAVLRSRSQLAHLLFRQLAWQDSQGLQALSCSLGPSSSISSFSDCSHTSYQQIGLSTSTVASAVAQASAVAAPEAVTPLRLILAMVKAALCSQ